MKGTKFTVMLLLLSCAHQEQDNPILRVINSRSRQFQQCHIESDSHKEAGEVTLRASLRANGLVRDTHVQSSTFRDPNLHACLEGILSPLKFPPGYAEELEIPLTFQSGTI